MTGGFNPVDNMAAPDGMRPDRVTAESANVRSVADRRGATSAQNTAVTKKGRVLSVRTKGFIVFVALMGYALFIAFFVFHQKEQLVQDFNRMQDSLQIDTMLKRADTAAFNLVTAIGAAGGEGLRPRLPYVQEYYRILHARNAELNSMLPSGVPDLGPIGAALSDAGGAASTVDMHQLVTNIAGVKEAYIRIAADAELNRQKMSGQYLERADSLVMATLLLGGLGLAVLGTIMGFFFQRLTEDLCVLQSRALAIVNGERLAPLVNRRRDEVGQLIVAVNSMATTLDKREKELMLERQKYFHQEKMAAIGSLAAGVAHEIGNPIAAISGIAQEMAERRDNAPDPCTAERCQSCRPDLIQAQTQRLAAITREISEFASPLAAEPQLLDLNAQLRSTASLIRYDKRLQRIALDLRLDHSLPAMVGIADQLTQLIMNLLINAMDALDGITDRQPVITISTRAEPDGVWLVVADNGCGMDREVLDRVFEAFFTTKPAGKGTGLGLSLCYSIMKNHGGSIDIESDPGKGTQVHAFFPLNQAV